jgi:hypothetical protein
MFRVFVYHGVSVHGMIRQIPWLQEGEGEARKTGVMEREIPALREIACSSELLHYAIKFVIFISRGS